MRVHLETTSGVVYQSFQSYYELLVAAGITSKQAQATNPERTDEQVAAKKMIQERLTPLAHEIATKQVMVLYLDECHLVWGDACGYVWGPSDQRIRLPIGNR